MMKRLIGLLGVLSVALSHLLVAQVQPLVLEGGTLIDATGRRPINNAVVLVEGDRIKAVGIKGQITYPPNATVINTNGATILPGLIDGHIHLYAAYMPQMMLRYGITTVADTNNQTDWILLQREALNTGKIKGPRMFVSGSAADGPTAVTSTDGNIVVVSLRTEEEAREHVRHLVGKGVDMIKTGYSLTDEQLAAVVDEAKKAGLPVLGHSRNMRKAAELGLKYTEHMNTVAWALLDDDMGFERWRREGYTPERFMDESKFPSLIQLMVKEGVYVNPTLVANWRASSPRSQEMASMATEVLRDRTLAAMVPADAQRAWAELGSPRARDMDGFTKVQKFIAQYVKAGGKVLAATDDTGVSIPGLSLHYEMQMLTDAGIPAMVAIQAATLWNAQAIGREKDLGSVEPGKLADFVIVEGDPLTNIAATKNIRSVIKDGRVVDTAYDPKSITRVPRPFGLVPTITRVNPPVVRQDTRSAQLEVEGTRFNRSSIVRFDNTDLATQYVSETRLTATVEGRLLGRPGSYSVHVLNPGDRGSVSNNIFLFVDPKE